MQMLLKGVKLPEPLVHAVEKEAAREETTFSHIVRRTLIRKFTPHGRKKAR